MESQFKTVAGVGRAIHAEVGRRYSDAIGDLLKLNKWGGKSA
jgi:hypothetical protein